jgi:hypothetical protein
MVTIIISRLWFQNLPLPLPITVSLYYKTYYSGSFTLIDSGVPVDVNGNITASPLPSASIDPSQKYVLRAVNEQCGAVYDQALFINPYCPPGYALASDDSFCYVTLEIAATPPGASENTVPETNVAYTDHASFIYDPGYNVDGTGTSTIINPANTWWWNSIPNTSAGPLNRSGLWATTTLSSQTVGFSVCINVAVDSTMYVGMGVDNFGSIVLDGTTIVNQDVAALQAQYDLIYPGIGPAVTFKIWHIYPVFFAAGSHALEIIGNNDSGIAAMGCEVYNLTASQIAAATSYADMGAGLVFSSKDFIGMPVQLGSDDIGYSCPAGYSLKYCDSPVVCVRTITTPILY